MKQSFIILLMFVLAIGVSAQGSSSHEVVMPKICIDGYFFADKPEAMPEGCKIFLMKDSVGNKVLGVIYPEGVALSEEAKGYAIPKERVSNLKFWVDEYASKSSFMAIVGGSKSSASVVSVGGRFPKFVAKDIEGKSWSEKDMKDRVMVLNLWYSGCSPCLKEMPELSGWRDSYKDVLFLSSTFEDEVVARRVVEKHGFNWNHLVDDKQFTKWLGGKGYPMTLVVDKRGVIRLIENGTSPVQRGRIVEMIEVCAGEGD